MAGVIAGSDPGCKISKPVPWPRRTCDPLLSFSNEGRTAPAAACSVEPFLVTVSGIGVVELTGGDDSECLGDPVSGLFSTATAANGRLAERGIAGAVWTNCANGVTSGILDRRTAAGRASTLGGDGSSLRDGGVDATFASGLSPKYPRSFELDDAMPLPVYPERSTLLVGFLVFGVNCPVSAA